MISEYTKVKTGQDMDDLKIVAKSSPAHLSIITSKRLDALRDRVRDELQGHELGKWVPAVRTEDASSAKSGVKKKYLLIDGVTADPSIGHRVRFSEGYKGVATNSGGDQDTVEFEAGRVGMITAYDVKRGEVSIVLDKTKGRQEALTYRLGDLEKILEVSSLGGTDPKESEEAVREETLSRFFPRTVLGTHDSERAIIAMLLGKPIVLYGPPGSGKSECSRDINDIAKQQDVIFVEKDCDQQCNPYSIFDERFAKECPPCPKCMMKYCPDFRKTGIFVRPNPKDVEVIVCSYSEGHGLEFLEGTTSPKRMHLAGYKLPSLDRDVAASRENEFDPEGFHPGVLVRTNNGVLRVEEIDKLREQTQADFLEALERKRIKPDELRFSLPAYGVIVGTANDVTKLTGPLNDRMFFLKIPYPRDVEVSYDITRRAYHKEVSPVEDVPITNSHKTPPLNIRGIPMPAPMERAVDAFYLKLRAECREEGVNEIMGSNRSKIDALDIARVKLLIDQKFYRAAPAITGPENAIFGIQYALCTRVQEGSFEKDHDVKVGLCKWVETNFPKVLKEEENTWWCEAFQDVSIAKTQAPQIEDNFRREWGIYSEIVAEDNGDFTPVYKAYNAIKQARSARPDDLAAQAPKLAYPLMNHLFDNQPKMDKFDERQVKELMKYYMTTGKGANCKPDFIKK